jgi:predicted nucleotidyltransferase
MMTAKQNNPNITMLDLMAQRLGPELCENMVFVGGAAAGLLITDLALPAIRRTDDIDVVTPTQALEDFHKLENQLRELGFTPDMRPEAPLCRWQIDNMTVDVMPSKEEVLGFANRWYVLSVATAQIHELPSGTRVKVIRAPEFIATKLEAFFGRGQGDFLFSHDIGDIISVIDGRESLLLECQASHRPLREYLSLQFQSLLKNMVFLDSLPGHLPPDLASQERLPDLLQTIQHIAELSLD